MVISPHRPLVKALPLFNQLGIWGKLLVVLFEFTFIQLASKHSAQEAYVATLIRVCQLDS